MSRRDWGALLLLAAIWGCSYLLIKVGIRDLTPSEIACLRCLFGAIVLLPLALARRALGGFGGLVPMLVVVAIVQVAGPFFLIAAGEQEVASSLAGILVASVPIFSAVLAVAFDPEDRVRGLRAAGVGIGIVGVALLLGLDIEGSALLGALAILLASLGYAVGGLLTKKRLSGLQPLGIATWVLTISVPLTAPAAIAEAPAQTPGVGPLLAVAALGAVGTGIAFAVFYDLLARVGPARTFIVTYLAPGFAVLYGAVLLSERITAATIGGLCLILLGSYLAVDGRLPGRAGGSLIAEEPDSSAAPAEGGR